MPRSNQYDTNRDGEVTDYELEQARKMLELELQNEKADGQRRMAWVAVWSMVVFTVGLFLPIVSETRVAALADLLGLFYIAQAGVVGAYMGVTAWMSNTTRNRLSSTYQSMAQNRPKPSEPDDPPEVTDRSLR